MRTPRVLTAVIAVAVLAACGQSPPPAPTATGPSVAPPPAAVASTPVPPASPGVPERRPDTTGPGGTIKGRTVWPNVGDFRFTLQIVLLGDDPSTEGRMIAVRTRLGEPYSAWVVPAGGYLLKAQVGSIRLWEMRVNVEADKETTVDLTPAESSVSPAEFPVRG